MWPVRQKGVSAGELQGSFCFPDEKDRQEGRSLLFTPLPSSHFVLNEDAWSLTKKALRNNAKVSQVKNKKKAQIFEQLNPLQQIQLLRERKINYLFKPLRARCHTAI